MPYTNGVLATTNHSAETDMTLENMEPIKLAFKGDYVHMTPEMQEVFDSIRTWAFCLINPRPDTCPADTVVHEDPVQLSLAGEDLRAFLAFIGYLDSVTDSTQHPVISHLHTHIEKYASSPKDSDPSLLFVSASDFLHYKSFIMETLSPHDLLCALKLDALKNAWVRNWIDNNFQGLAGFMDDPEMLDILGKLDLVLQKRIASATNQASSFKVSSTSTVFILMRMQQYMLLGDHMPRDMSANQLSLLGCLLSDEDTYSCVSASLTVTLHKMYGRLGKYPAVIDEENKTGVDIADSGTPGSGVLVRQLFKIELYTTYWIELRYDAHMLLFGKGESLHGPQEIDEGLLTSTSLKKKDLLQAFKRDIPFIKQQYISHNCGLISPEQHQCKAQKCGIGAFLEVLTVAQHWNEWAGETGHSLLNIEMNPELTAASTNVKIKIITLALKNLTKKTESMAELGLQMKRQKARTDAYQQRLDQLTEKNNCDFEFIEKISKLDINKNKEFVKVLKAREAESQALQKKIRDQEFALQDLTRLSEPGKAAEMERDIKSLQRQVKDLKEQLRSKDDQLHTRDRKAQKSGQKETKSTESGLRSQLEEEQNRAEQLEKELNILKLDYEAALFAVDELEANPKPADSDSNRELHAKIQALESERDRYKGLYDRNRNSEQIIQDKIRNAVRVAEAKKMAEFEVWKAHTADVAREAEQKLVAATLNAKATEQLLHNKDLEIESGIAQIGKADEFIRALSRAKLSLLEQTQAKDQEIDRLRGILATMGYESKPT